MGEYQIKMEALQEYETALRFRNAQEEILEAFQGLLREFGDYCERNGMQIPEPEKYRRILAASIALLQSQASPVAQRPFKSPSDATAPLDPSTTL